MHLSESTFYSKINKLTCFENKPHIAVGVSGGPDSMALVYLLNNWIKKKDGKLSALIFDHMLRSNSKEEAKFVNTMLKIYKINSYLIKVKKNTKIKNNMAQARANRFEGLINFCKKRNILHLFLGHQFDDNLETYLIRRVNGSNLEGLSSMSMVTTIDKTQILRPFISLNKKYIINFNQKNKIKFLNDPSNKNIKYTRVKVRQFLNKKSNYYNVKKDFNNISKIIPNYKTMIWELFISNLIEARTKKIKIKYEQFIRNDELIIEKQILLILKFFSNKKYQTKTSKIKLLIDQIKKNEFKIFNLSGVIIKKYSDFLIFSEK